MIKVISTFNKYHSLRRRIQLFNGSVFIGKVYIEVVEELFCSCEAYARKMAENLSWDSVVLYAIFEYDRRSSAFLSANLMNEVMKYEDYADIVNKMAKTNRFFFVRGRKEHKYE